MITLDTFITIINQEYLYQNFAGTNPSGAQCVNVINAWCRALGIEQFPGNAGSFEFDAHPDCDWIANTPTNVPLKGDIVIWSVQPALPFGHVDIFISGDVMTFNGLDQNWPINSRVHVQGHTYTNPQVKGWFHPRILNPQPDPCAAQLTQIAQLTIQLNAFRTWLAGAPK